MPLSSDFSASVYTSLSSECSAFPNSSATCLVASDSIVADPVSNVPVNLQLDLDHDKNLMGSQDNILVLPACDLLQLSPDTAPSSVDTAPSGNPMVVVSSVSHVLEDTRMDLIDQLLIAADDLQLLQTSQDECTSTVIGELHDRLMSLVDSATDYRQRDTVSTAQLQDTLQVLAAVNSYL